VARGHEAARWWREGRRVNDNIRMKNFPGYTPVSRAIVPRDLAGDPHDLWVKATIDGLTRLRTREDIQRLRGVSV
jgi:2-keto-4-pentenoate hydratase/2-oxohepta-3-ene-1,7-dioic acid hydratase in catechol pathway